MKKCPKCPVCGADMIPFAGAGDIVCSEELFHDEVADERERMETVEEGES